MSERADVLVTRPIMDGLSRSSGSAATSPCTRTRSASGAELLQVVRGRDAHHHDAHRAGGRRIPGCGGAQLEIVANHAVGFDNIDVAACTAAGVLATNTPLTETTADTAFALLMAAARRLGEGDRKPWIWGPRPRGDRTCTTRRSASWASRIGQAARRAKGFGMRVLYADAFQLPPDVEAETGAERREFDELLAEADFVSIHTNLTEETRHLFDEAFAKMKPTAVLVNTSRGPVVDEAALADALRDRRLRRPASTCSSGAQRWNPGCSRARERRRDPAPRVGHRRHPQRDGRPRRERVRGALMAPGRLRL